MNLTKEIRKDLAAQLTAKAIEKHAPVMAKKVKTLNTKFTEVHARHLASLIPEMPEKSWDRMIQLHISTGTAGGDFTAYMVKRDNNGQLNSSARTPGYIDTERKVDTDDINRIKKAMHSRWSLLLKTLPIRVGNWDSRLYLSGFSVSLDKVLPTFANDRVANLRALEPEHTKDTDQLEQARIRALAPLVKQVDELSAEFLSIITQALDYHEKVTDLLNSCRTDKQLENLFPEAAAMLPKPTKKAQPIVPVELAAQVRRMLADGVPA